MTTIDSGKPTYVVSDLRQNSGGDAVMPDQLIAPTFEAFRAGRDEVLEWILKAR